MKPYQSKTFSLKALDVDTSTKQVKVAIAGFGNKDRDGDVIVPEAAIKTIAQRGPKGSNEIWHLVDHNASLKSALGKFSELYSTQDHIVGVSKYKDEMSLWKDTIWPLYESGDINQHSIGFSVLKESKQKDFNQIEEIALWEGSAVLWGANPNTPTQGVFKSMTTEEKVDEIQSRFKRLRKGLKSEVDASLLIIEIKQLEQLIIDDVSTSAAKGTETAQTAFDLKELSEIITSSFKIN
jgi:hypothetical protein